MMKFLQELKKLNLPNDKFAVFGSGPLGIRKLREPKNVDIIVKADVWNRLMEKDPLKNESDNQIKIGHIEIWKDWLPWFKNVDKLIDEADIFDGIRYVKLERVLKWKQTRGNKKDKADVRLIHKYLKWLNFKSGVAGVHDGNIELEFRAEIVKENFHKTLKKLKQQGRLLSRAKRLSVMYFGKIGKDEVDIRVRITNGDAEVVVKKGGFHAHNRVEVSQRLEKDQFLGMTKIIAMLGFTDVKVGERETYNFDFGNGVIVSLGRGGDISYLEIEKMSTKKKQKQDIEELMNVIRNLDVQLIETRQEFEELCLRLTETCDWRFDFSEVHYQKLQKLVEKNFKQEYETLNHHPQF